jgi:hypothetical protein
MIVLNSDPQRHFDEETARLIPPDAAIRIGREDVARNLAVALTALIDEPSRISAYAQAAGNLAARLLSPWDARIDQEIALLRG